MDGRHIRCERNSRPRASSLGEGGRADQLSKRSPNRMRSRLRLTGSPADIETTSPDRDLLLPLTRDQWRLEHLIRVVEETPSPRQRYQATVRLMAELTCQAVVREEHLYPFLADVIPHGDRLADQLLCQDHQDAETMRQLEETDPDSAEFSRLSRILTQRVRHRIEVERSRLFPALRDFCLPDDLRRVTSHLAGGEHTARTRLETCDLPDGPGFLERVYQVVITALHPV